MARRQWVITVMAPVRPGQEKALRGRLDDLGKEVRRNQALPFERITKAHFARFLILDPMDGANGDRTPTRLVFSSVYDGAVGEHLMDWIEQVGATFHEIFGHCEGYPVAAADRPHAV